MEPFLDESYYLHPPKLTANREDREDPQWTEVSDVCHRIQRTDVPLQSRREAIGTRFAQTQIVDPSIFFDRNQDFVTDLEDLRETLVCIPFIQYGPILKPYIKSGRLATKDMECVKLILVTALALASDEALLQEETEQLYETMRATLTAFSRDAPELRSASAQEQMRYLFRASL
jgi:hypothetical protein